MAIDAEGAESSHVTDAYKITCDFCGGTQFMVSSLMDDPNDITEDTDFSDLDITITDGHFHGLVGLCKQCGHEKVFLWYCIDVGTADNAAGTVTMTNLDAGTADTLADYYMIPCVGDDIGKYHVVASHTEAAPTVITTDTAPAENGDGVWIITNILPLGLTEAS